MIEDKEIEAIKSAIASLTKQKNISSEETLRLKEKKLKQSRLQNLCKNLTLEQKQLLMDTLKGGE